MIFGDSVNNVLKTLLTESPTKIRQQFFENYVISLRFCVKYQYGQCMKSVASCISASHSGDYESISALNADNPVLYIPTLLALCSSVT